jgi:hypothetical protein
LGILLLSPVLYLASLGPVALLIKKTHSPAWLLRWSSYTKPAGWLCEFVPGLTLNKLDRYIDWWIRR